MIDRHLTSSLEHAPFRQYRVGQLEEVDLDEVSDELRLLAERYHKDPQEFTNYVRAGGKLAIASRLTAVEAPHGPSDVEIEAIALQEVEPSVSPSDESATVYARDETPLELMLYLEGYVTGKEVEHPEAVLTRLPPASAFRG